MPKFTEGLFGEISEEIWGSTQCVQREGLRVLDKRETRSPRERSWRLAKESGNEKERIDTFVPTRLLSRLGVVEKFRDASLGFNYLCFSQEACVDRGDDDPEPILKEGK